MEGEILKLETAEKLARLEKVKTLIADFCETCGSHENCPEEECVLFMIEALINEGYEVPRIKKFRKRKKNEKNRKSRNDRIRK